MSRFLHFQFTQLTITHPHSIDTAYLSLSHQDQHYFTTTFDQHSSHIDDIFIPVDAIPESVALHRWENHMILFSHSIEIPELKSRNALSRLLQTKQQEWLTFRVALLDSDQLLLMNRSVENVLQHYLIIQQICLLGEKQTQRIIAAPNYFLIEGNRHTHILPIRNGCLVLKLPEKFTVSCFRNGLLVGKTVPIDALLITDGFQIPISLKGQSDGKLEFKLKWAIRQIQKGKASLLNTHEILLYDFETKSENPGQLLNCRLKLKQGTRCFEFTEELNNSKMLRIRKIGHFVVKSQNQELEIIVQKNNKTYSKCVITTAELKNMGCVRRKLEINEGKPLLSIKFQCEFSRNVSLPQNNRVWRESPKNRQTPCTLFLQQVSVRTQSRDCLQLSVKSDIAEKIIQNVTNVNEFLTQENLRHEIVDLPIKGEESVYFMLKSDNESSDFVGVTVINPCELHLGANTKQIQIFKSQVKTGTINCIVHKIISFPFMKQIYRPHSPTPVMAEQYELNVFVTSIQFSPYYYAFKYERKYELYCIAEVEKCKKVLILDPAAHDDLLFNCAPGSDLLLYSVHSKGNPKVKFTFLASDLGHEEEIYGTANWHLSIQDLAKEPTAQQIAIYNEFTLQVGTIKAEFTHKKSIAEPAERLAEVLTAKAAISKKEQNISKKLRGVLLERQSKELVPGRRYSGHTGSSSTPAREMESPLKLPMIPNKKDSYQDAFQLMKIRKRGRGGQFDGIRPPEKLETVEELQSKRDRMSFDLGRIERSNPNLLRNLEILFPKKAAERNRQRRYKGEYEDRLRGLKSVMKEISQDIGEVQPTLRDSFRAGDAKDSRSAEWEGNEFAES